MTGLRLPSLSTVKKSFPKQMIPKEQKAEFDAIADKYLAPLMPEYSEIVNRFISGYKKLFPKHLNDDADRLCNNLFMGMYSVIIEYAQRTEAIKLPSPNCFCDVLIQFK